MAPKWHLLAVVATLVIPTFLVVNEAEADSRPLLNQSSVGKCKHKSGPPETCFVCHTNPNPVEPPQLSTKFAAK